jgi:hypothetical protein
MFQPTACAQQGLLSFGGPRHFDQWTIGQNHSIVQHFPNYVMAVKNERFIFSIFYFVQFSILVGVVFLVELSSAITGHVMRSEVRLY